MTISHIDHIAVVVKSISEAKLFYEGALGLKVYHEEELLDRGIKTAFIKVGPTDIELIESLGPFSEVHRFIENKGYGIHHLAFATDDVKCFCNRLKRKEVPLIYDEAKIGAHEAYVNFIHPKASQGVLIELVEK